MTESFEYLLHFPFVLVLDYVSELAFLCRSLLGKSRDLPVTRLQLRQDSVQIYVLKDLQVLHLVYELSGALALGGLVLLKPGFLAVQALQLALKLLDELFVACKRKLGQVQLLLSNLLSLLSLG